MIERRRFHWSDLLPDSFGLLKRAARAGQLAETFRTIESAKELEEEFSSILEEMDSLVSTFEEGTVQWEDSIKVEALRTRLSVVYGRQKEFTPALREKTASLIRVAYTNLEKLDAALAHLFPEKSKS